MIDGLSEKENELVLRSLREYSESCEAPELIPECPFSIEIGQNERGCGEECMDLLGKHEAPRPHRRTEIGTGLVISRPMRPRPRRSGEFEGRPFDAKEVYLQDSENSAPHRWRLPALLYAIKETTQTPPNDNTPVVERQDHIGDLLDSLAQCGITTRSLVDPWIRQHASRAIFGRAYAQWLSNRTSQTNPVVESWVQLLDEVVPREIALSSTSAIRDPDNADAALNSLMRATLSWSQSAPLTEIIGWTPPSNLETAENGTVGVATSDANWLFDRFTVTYLDDWSTASLRSEWQYLHGELDTPWPRHLTKARRMAEPQLASVIADRLLREHDRHRSHVHHFSLTDQLVGPALDFLGEGRRIEAAALFEAAIRHDGDDAPAHNNLAFCLLPDRPEAAVSLLERAIKLGGPQFGHFKANCVLALAHAGRYTSALSLAHEFLLSANTSFKHDTWHMWKVDGFLDGDEPCIEDCDDLSEYVESIVGWLDNYAYS